MYKIFSKYGTFIAFIIGLVFTLIFLIPVFSGLPEGFSELSGEEQVATTVFDSGLKATLILLIASVVVLILASIYATVINPKGAVKGIIGIAALLILMFVLYSTTGDESNARVLAAMDQFNISETMGRWIGACLKGTFILSLVAVAIMVLGELRTLFR